MTWFRNFDLVGSLWCLIVAGGFAGFFFQGERVFREIGTPLQELGWGASFPFYSSLAISVAALVAFISRSVLWAVIGLVAIRLIVLVVAGALGPNELPPVERAKFLDVGAVTIGGSYWMLRLNAERHRRQISQANIEEFDNV
ncbi:MAG: hypothetical protein AAFX86_05775 [Pseudomonadota bacterium]